MMQRSKNIERRQSKAIEEKSDLLKNIETIEKLKIFPLEYSNSNYVILIMLRLVMINILLLKI